MADNHQDYDHIVLVSIDTLRSDAIATSPVRAWAARYRVQTQLRPSVLDELAATGSWFPNCVSAAPYTSASHASYLTGRWPLRHGVYELFNKALQVPTVISQAREAGYQTMMKVDFPLMLGEHLGFTRDVDEYIVEDDEAALRFLAGSRRAFSFVHFSGAHIPYGFAAAESGGDEFAGAMAAVERQAPRAELPGGVDPAGTLSVRQHRRYLGAVERLYHAGAYDVLFSLYLEGVNRFLHNRFSPFMRRLLATLDMSRTLVVVFGDHGEEYDAENFAHQNSVSDGVLRVPLILVGAGVRPARHDGRIRSVDLVPSLQDLAGLPPAIGLDGASLARTIRDATPYPTREAFAQSYIADIAAHVQHVKRALLGNREPGTLAHTLLQETAYVGAYRVVRRWARQEVTDGTWHIRTIPPEVRVEHEQPDSSWMPAPAEAGAEALRRLEAYRALGDGPAPTPVIDPVLRAQLQALGYRI